MLSTYTAVGRIHGSVNDSFVESVIYRCLTAGVVYGFLRSRAWLQSADLEKLGALYPFGRVVLQYITHRDFGNRDPAIGNQPPSAINHNIQHPCKKKVRLV